MKKIRILQSVGSLGMGGNEIFVMNLFRNIDKDRFQVDFVIYDDSRMDFYDEIINGGSKVYICKSKIHNQYLKTISNIINVRRILKENKYDVIHCHSCSFLGIFRGAIAGSLVKNIKVISHSHNPGMPKNNILDNFIRRVFKKYLSRITDLGFACSDGAAESKYTKKFIKSSKFKIINNAIDIDRYLYNTKDRKMMRKKYGIEDKFVIGNIGRLEQQKNHEFLLKVFYEIRKKRKDSKLIIVGEGKLEDKLKKYVAKNNMESDVIFIGKVKDSSKYYQMMDVFVMTSIYEGFPFVMVESQVNGLPAVLSSVITQDVNISGNVKFLDLDSDLKVWADEILDTFRDERDITFYKNACKEYDLAYQANLLEDYYKKLTNNNQ